ncbi:ABC transporter substrate-binding protein [Nocardioides jiangxiensis]|uniref:ABC transporter substrate-binding protein n=1 Tax=Nocardioides jiangxiensis TaxID=3064524 RepID=A0ABT9B062_9ACTN|nr:ABC transporter substrate-binding protein [Nocardioides sp. WY-20]MDO7868220.1 ABC transporter substrate-binding protein [Nocardioides sp. WY-20]
MNPLLSRRPVALLAAAAATCALATACGSSDSASPKADSSIATQKQDAALNAKLPADIRKAGVIKVGTEAQYPPFESLADDNKTIVGLDPDLAAAIGQVLGVKLVYTNIAFDGLLPALDAGRFDMIQAAVTDTKVREKQYDFVDYFMTGQAIVVKKGNPDGIGGVSDLCGRAVAVLKGSTQLKMLDGFNDKECAGNAIKVTALPTDKDALLQLQTGRADATFTQDAVGAYNVKNIGGGNQFEIANSEALLPTPVGIAFTKADTQLRDAVSAAIAEVIKSGAYDEILAKYSLSGGAVDAPAVNGAVD